MILLVLVVCGGWTDPRQKKRRHGGRKIYDYFTIITVPGRRVGDAGLVIPPRLLVLVLLGLLRSNHRALLPQQKAQRPREAFGRQAPRREKGNLWSLLL